MIIISNIEFNYLMDNGKMYKFLRFFNRFSRDDEPLMILTSLGNKRVGTCRIILHCVLQGKSKVESLDRYVKDTPYKDSIDWMNEIDKLYSGQSLHNGYIFLLELNKVSVSIVNTHPSCKGCVKVNGCSEYKDLKDSVYCLNRLSTIEIDSPLVVIRKYKDNLFEILNELDKIRDIENRNDIMIKIAELRYDIMRWINVLLYGI